MLVKRVSEVIAPMVEEAIGKHALGEEFWYDAIPAMTENGIAVAVTLLTRSPIVGQALNLVIMIQNPLGVTAAEIDEVIEQAVGQMKLAISGLVQAPPKAPGLVVPAANGHRHR